MTEIVHADIFFFITSLAVIIIGVGLTVVIYYSILILRDVRAILQKVRKTSDELAEDFEEVRAEIKKTGMRVRTIFELALTFLTLRIPKVRPKQKVKTKDIVPHSE